AMNVLYQFLSIIIRTDTGQPLRSKSGKITSHISGLFYRSINFIENGIKPVYVFDGKPSTLKHDTISERKQIRQESKEEHKKALKEGDMEKAYKYAKTSFRVTKEMVDDSKEFLKAMGIPYVQAKSEGEAQAAYMVQNGDAWAVGSQDYDSLLFGAPILVRNLSIAGKRRGKGGKTINVEPEIIKLQELLDENDLTQEKLIGIGILIGTDFNDGIKGVGIKTALKYIKKYDDFQTLIKKEDLSFEIDYQEIKKIFLNPRVKTEYKIGSIKPKYDKLKELLIDLYDFNEKRVENGIVRLKKGMNKQSQKSLDSFFGKN
ncbi:MAG: flap endonuclease-1, partial [Candidatus Lokiarchaeota archaeon]|nr:flap endonuclease-1 [Candidatus Lokiarchaeota archaeon]